MIYCNSDYEKLIRNEHFDYLNPLPPIERFYERFRLLLTELPLHLLPDDVIFGWFGHAEKLPESELRVFDDCVRTDDEQSIMYAQAESGSTTYVDKSHVCADYGYIISHGLRGYEEQIKRELEKEPDSVYLEAMQKSIDIVRAFMKRLSEKTEQELAAAYGDRREKLIRIKNAVEKVPYLPADNFLEAIQSIWIIHFLIPLAENGWCSVSLGPVDKYLLPYYRKALEEGMSRDEIKGILHNFYLLLNSYSDGACLVNVGSEFNELSELLIECQKDFSMPAPILGARISPETPDEVLFDLIDERLFLRGQPTFYSEEGCISALVEKGVPAEEAKNFTNNSCMGIGIPGAEVNSMWGCVFCTSSSLEAALNRGRIVTAEAQQVVPGIGEIKDTEELFTAFEKSVDYWFGKCAVSYEAKAAWYEEREPDVFLSVITKNSIEMHCDRLRAAKYHNITVECMGMVNVADGICAIDELVFRRKKYTIEEISEAVVTNYAGRADILEDIRNCPKYGRDEAADAFAERVADIMQRVIRSRNHDNYYYSPSLHTLDANVKYGLRWGAGYDGRKSGEPFAKNAGPSNLARTAGPTSVVLAAAKLPQQKFYGGQPIDVHFQTDTVKNHKPEIAALVRTYLENGGLQFQVNALSSAVLREATEKPEEYEDLVVRIGGYSCYFNSLTQASKEEFIKRFEIEEG